MKYVPRVGDLIEGETSKRSNLRFVGIILGLVPPPSWAGGKIENGLFYAITRWYELKFTQDSHGKEAEFSYETNRQCPEGIRLYGDEHNRAGNLRYFLPGAEYLFCDEQGKEFLFTPRAK